jgi:hypothetical protein
MPFCDGVSAAFISGDSLSIEVIPERKVGNKSVASRVHTVGQTFDGSILYAKLEETADLERTPWIPRSEFSS